MTPVPPLASRQVDLHIACSAQFVQRRPSGNRERRTAQSGVQHHARRVDHPIKSPQPRQMTLAQDSSHNPIAQRLASHIGLRCVLRQQPATCLVQRHADPLAQRLPTRHLDQLGQPTVLDQLGHRRQAPQQFLI